ncbi:hypothetical protein M434DRAFT_389999 [Hypoxylon sp. CO27-5]|nr:hypothetical protein M434DRAFT_389999 [Hypoxylon sp. CO27-5]
MDMNTATHSPVIGPETIRREIALIGCGPRGTMTLERLCASTPDFLSQNTVLTIHVIDSSLPGSGAIWNPSQSPYLLMNTAASHMTLFTDESVTCVGPIRPGPSLYEWITMVEPGIGPNDFAARAQYGRYLEWGFADTVRKAPSNIRIELHRSRAVRLDDVADNTQTVTLSNGLILSGLSAVILAQGHLPSLLNADQELLRSYAITHSIQYIPPASPATVDLSSVGPGEAVVIRGLGLTFFDYMTLLTEGRGGRYDRIDGRLIYRPSGSEPRLYAGSSRGIPYHSRGVNQKGVVGTHTPFLLTEKVVEWFRSRSNTNDKPNFRAEIWPLVAKEVETVYYEALMRQLGISYTGFRLLFLANPYNNDQDNAILDEFNIPEGDRWSWSRLLKPYDQNDLATTISWRNWMVNYLHEDVRTSRSGTVDGPLKAAIDVMRDLRDQLRPIVNHRGLSGISRRDDLDKWYTPFNSFLSIGPPPLRIEQMVALMEAGILETFGPRLEVKAENRAWIARSLELPNNTVRATTLIDAFVPTPRLESTADELLNYLKMTGQCRQHTLDGYVTGALDVSPSFCMIDYLGREHERRFAMGIPIEGVLWITADGAKPGVNSEILRQVDSVAREALNQVMLSTMFT